MIPGGVDGEMSVEDSINYWLEGLRNRDERAAQVLWERYFARLAAYAGK